MEEVAPPTQNSLHYNRKSKSLSHLGGQRSPKTTQPTKCFKRIALEYGKCGLSCPLPQDPTCTQNYEFSSVAKTLLLEKQELANAFQS
jgi:hypothetical protein